MGDPLRAPPGIGPAQLADHRDHLGCERIRRGVGPPRTVCQTGQPTKLVPGDPGVHRLARGSKLPSNLGFRYSVEDLQNGAVSVLGHPITGITR